MTTKSPILLFFWFFVLSLALQAETIHEPFSEVLPSQQTEQDIQNLSESLNEENLPQLRARPGDITDNELAQKVPVGDFGWLEFISLLVAFSAYVYLKKRRMNTDVDIFKIKHFKCLFITALIGFTANLAFAQIEVTHDNYYIRPGTRAILDVMVNDNPGNCANTKENLKLEIISPSPIPTTLQNLEVSADNKIVFRAKPSFHGQIKITYKITCSTGGNSSATGHAYVNVGDLPDFINDAECTIDPQPFVWDIEKKNQSDKIVSSLITPLVGDLLDANKKAGQDGNFEILALGAAGTHLRIFDSNLQLVNSIPIAPIHSGLADPFAIADVNSDGIVEIIYCSGYDATTPSNCFRVYAYNGEGTLIWQSSTAYLTDAAILAAPDRAVNPVIADVDGDGLVEILVGDKIFAGENGNLLKELPAGGRALGKQGVHHWGNLPTLADVDGDGKMEAICGNTTYKLNDLTNRSNPALNSVTVLATAPAGYLDGFCSVADIDGDGILDVVVTEYPGKMYVWQGHQSAIIGSGRVGAGEGLGSRPFIGDIDGDGQPDIAFTAIKIFEAFKYNRATGTFSQMFTTSTSDVSGRTTMSVFDFNLDGEAELVYRDESLLRIIDKNGNNVKDQFGNPAVFECLSETSSEYPIVVDLDGDGHTEILVTGCTKADSIANGTARRGPGRLMLFGSKTPGTWAPARRIWHQHAYNPVYINEDLSVPQKPLSPTTQIMKKDGSIHTPFNNFLQQSGILNSEGESLNLAIDLTFQVNRNPKLYLNASDELEITTFITNDGSIDFSGDIKLSLYLYNSTTGTYSHQGTHIHTSQTLAMKENKTYFFKVPNYSSITFPADYQWFVVINLDDQSPAAPSGAYKKQYECNYWNNLTSQVSYISGQLVLCEGDSDILNIDPSGIYDCYWFNPDKTAYPSAGNNKGDSKSVTKQAGTYKDYLLIDVYPKGGSIKINSIPDTVFIYNAPDTLVWTGNIDSDWHNILNWHNPNDVSKEQIASYIPRPCTNVHIPDGLVNYPNLTSGSTSYNDYNKATCNNITFEHGGEVQHSELLTYSKAYVQVELLSNRWYCFSPPLRDLYSGDIYLNDKNPFLDNMFIYTRQFLQVSKPGFLEGNWDKTFNRPDVLLQAGSGLGVWADDLDPNPNNQQPILFKFPKHDTAHFMYHDDGTVHSGPYPVSTANRHRFIFEETINTSTKEIQLQPSSTQASVDILIGNPFMSHWDFKTFYNYGNNKNLIEDHYRVIDADGNYSTYSISGVSTGSPVLTNLIAPMQAILVTPKTAFAALSLVAHPSQTINSAGNKLRSAQETAKNADDEYILISLSDSKIRNRAALIYSPDNRYDNSYNKNGDILKVLRMGTKNPNVYIVSQEGQYVDIKSISNLDGVEIPIGICGEFKGSLALSFERLWEFAHDYDVFLLDKKQNKEVNLKLSSIYSFEATNTGDNSINDRFVLRFIKQGSSIEESAEKQTNISYRQIGNNVEFFTEDSNTHLEVIEVYGLDGRMITSKRSINSPSSSFSLKKGVYVIKARTIDKFESFKIIIY